MSTNQQELINKFREKIIWEAMNIIQINPMLDIDESDIDKIIEIALSDINAAPPVTTFTLQNFPFVEYEAVLYHATKMFLYRFFADRFIAEPSIEGLAGPYSSTRDLRDRFLQLVDVEKETYIKLRSNLKLNKGLPIPAVTTDPYYPDGRVFNRYPGVPFINRRRWW